MQEDIVYHLAPNGVVGIVLDSTGIPVSLWILNRNKIDNPKFRKNSLTTGYRESYHK